MIEKLVLDTVKKHGLFGDNTVVTVALSGGADSMCLLNSLVNLSDSLNITVKAAHLNHLIRGDEAMRDEEFVKVQCKKLGVELKTERIDVPEFAKKNHQSLELAARTLRYEFLNRINEGIIATAHTASDNLETVLLNLTRGTAIDGLCGIPIKRGSFVRPLLYCTREMIEDYCEENNVLFVTDSTNLSDDYTRNKIRHSVIPSLKEINPAIHKSVLRTCSSLKEISDSLKFETNEFLSSNTLDGKLSLADFKKLNVSVAKRVIVEFIKSIDAAISLENCHIEKIYKICIDGGKTSIPKNKYCVCDKKYLFITTENENQNTEFSVSLEKTDAKFLSSTKNVNNLFLNNALDCDTIIGKLKIRTRRPGDSIRLKNRGCTKPLTKLYNECDIPIELRDVLPVISDDNGVVWIYNIGVAQRCCVREKTKTVYKIEVKIKES